MPGPIPKREEQRVRDTPPGDEITKIEMDGPVKAPQLHTYRNLITHPISKGIYESLKLSGQSKFYEPSDWATAIMAIHLLDKQLKSQSASPTMIAAIWQILTSLGVTEGERRRMRIEVERKTGLKAAAEVIPISKVYEDRLRSQQQA